MNNHYLKTETQYYQDIVERETKTFEVRKNDRDFHVRDCVYLDEVVEGIPTGRQSKQFEIGYILHGGKFGLKEGYCILQLR